ncbi:MAG: low-complexity tail membrane protein [Spirulinaceae cyanobacterium]
MRTYRQDPYLWLHLAGLAVLPLWGLALWLGVAAGESWLPYGVEEAILVVLGVAPWLWVQWQRPFNPFSVLLVSLPPQRLTPAQCQWLQLLKSTRTRIVAVLAVLPAVWWLGQCYQLAPLATAVTPIPNHGLGLLVAAIAFSGANLFLQVSLSMVGLLLLTSEQRFAATEPYAVDRIGRDFFRFGPQLPRILPPIAPSDSPLPVEPEPISPEPEIVEPDHQDIETVSPAMDQEQTDVATESEEITSGDIESEDIEPEGMESADIKSAEIEPEGIESADLEAATPDEAETDASMEGLAQDSPAPDPPSQDASEKLN